MITCSKNSIVYERLPNHAPGLVGGKGSREAIPESDCGIEALGQHATGYQWKLPPPRKPRRAIAARKRIRVMKVGPGPVVPLKPSSAEPSECPFVSLCNLDESNLQEWTT